MTETLPLNGLRVLDIGTFIAAPFAATVLSEFGAEVIKIEKPGVGDPLRNFGTPTDGNGSLCWISEGRNKKSITLDLSKPRGCELFLSLVEKADVVCESFRPGTLEKWGLDFDRLKRHNPNIVLLRVSGFGQTGPLRGRIAFARVAHAFGGLSHLTGMPGSPPLTPGSTSIADYVTGLFGAIGVLVALRAREKAGGQVIDLALYESIFRILDDLAPTYSFTGAIRGPVGMGTSNACPHGHFKCGDGQWAALACSSDKMFARLASLMGKPSLATDEAYSTVAKRLENREKVDALVGAWFARLSCEEAIEKCSEADVPCSRINTIADIFADDHFRARQNLVSVEQASTGTLTLPNVIPKLSATPGRIQHGGQALGHSNAVVYSELLDLTEEDLAQLTAEGVI